MRSCSVRLGVGEYARGGGVCWYDFYGGEFLFGFLVFDGFTSRGGVVVNRLGLFFLVCLCDGDGGWGLYLYSEGGS